MVKTVILPADSASLREAADLLLSGEVVAIPTETVYGLAADGFSPLAVRKIFSAKGRPSTDPLILHLPSPDLKAAISAGILADCIPEDAYRLVTAFWPGPLTLILPRGPKVPLEVTAGLSSVAVRYPAHPVAQKLLTLLHELNGKILLILDGGESTTGVESTVVSLLTPEPTILRPGKITHEDIARVIGRTPCQLVQNLPKNLSMTSPGMLESHYAPQTPLYLAEAPISHTQPDLLFIHYHTPQGSLHPNQLILSPQGDPESAARNLYRILRQADSRQGKAILIEPVPDSSLAPALRDRLQRASVGIAKWDGANWILQRQKEF
ncbi:MAG: L-threonylcarbamoyladenylate synthase [Verrucomicrobia bacterium]|nr:L-threonylcarbamoyladenylate synthase [Verrucomicrobiota bacterium]